MSGKATGIVWESALERPEKYVLLALADHAKDDGTDVYPSLWKIMWKTGYSETQVRDIMRGLMAKKILVKVHQGGKRDADTNRYKIDYKAVPMLTDFTEWSAAKRAAEKKNKGAKTVPSSTETAPSPEGTVLDAGGYGLAPNEGTAATAPKRNTLERNTLEQDLGNSASELPTNGHPSQVNLPAIELTPPEPETKAKIKPQDPRFPEICEVIRKCWPKGDAYKCDITQADAGAINRMLAAKHDWKLEELALCIVARFTSASVNPTESVKAWIGAVTDYSSGPQDKFKTPLYADSALNRWRNEARVILWGPQPEQLDLKAARTDDTQYVLHVKGDVGATAQQLFASFRESMRHRLKPSAFTQLIEPLKFSCLAGDELHIVRPQDMPELRVVLDKEIKGWLPQRLKDVRFISPAMLKVGA